MNRFRSTRGLVPSARFRLGRAGVLPLLLAVISFVTVSCSKGEKDAAAPRLRTAPVSRTDLVDYLAAPGVLEARQSVQLKSEVSGQIATIRVREGDAVKKGDTLLFIDPLQLRNRQKQQKLAVEKSRIQLAQARRNYENGKGLLEVGGLAPQALEDLRYAMELERIRLEENALALRESEILLAKSVVLAPFSGTLTALSVKEGEVIVAGTASVGGGTALGELANLDSLTVTLGVSEIDFPNLRDGQNALISTEGRPEEKFPGHVEFLSKVAKEVKGKSVRNFDVRVSLDSAAPHLVPGINVLCEFEILRLEGVPALPFDLVYGENKGGKFRRYVWKVVGPGGAESRKGRDGAGRDGKGEGEGPRVEKTYVKTGRTDYSFIEIQEGLTLGDRVREEAGTRKEKPAGRRPPGMGRRGGP